MPDKKAIVLAVLIGGYALVVSSLLPAAAQGPAPVSSAATIPIDSWRSAAATGQSPALSSFYSSQPAVRVLIGDQELSGAAEETRFWEELKKKGLRTLVLGDLTVVPAGDNLQQATAQLELESRTKAGARTSYMVMQQLWNLQNGQWKIIAVKRGPMTRLKQPLGPRADLYPALADAHLDIQSALTAAQHAHKRVLLDFGANWCYDCHVLDLALHRPELKTMLDAGYVVVHVDVGKMDKNLDVAELYQVPLNKGIPALAVLDGNGKLLFSQRQGEFESARSLAPEDLSAFLVKWKASR